ncbi:hypothetical protein [Lawsonella clevelandensis]|uniref:hypothetical protein n=1 Tax=Lawsonella clevelandensis TaxID=1528099 RepID=UPI0029133353|nr:hypothetical protein [Lawsonella clevelandensis]MDU7192903.1 hypothetical protein [Lawsonella clevelandensis]
MTTSLPVSVSPTRVFLRKVTAGVSSLALGAGLLLGPASVSSQAAPVSNEAVPAPSVPFSVVNDPQDPPVPPTSPSPEESPGEDKGDLNVAGVDSYVASPAQLRHTIAALRERQDVYQGVDVSEVQEVAQHNLAVRVPRIEALNQRRARVGLHPVVFNRQAQDIADVAAAAIKDHTRYAVSRYALYPWINRITNTCVKRDHGVALLGHREKCYWTFVVDAPRYANADAALKGVSLGEILYDSTSSEVGVSGGELAGLGRQYLVFVVHSTFLSVGDRWASYEKWDLGRRSAKVEGSGSPNSNSESGLEGIDAKWNSGRLFSKGVENQLLVPWRVTALQAAYTYHGIPVTVRGGSEEQMLANTLHFFLEQYLKENSTTPERGVYEFSRLPLGVNVAGVTITGKKYRQYVAITPSWKGPLATFRDINAGDSLFQRAMSKIGIAGFTISSGKKIWIFVTQAE